MPKTTGQFKVVCLDCKREFTTDKDPEAETAKDRPECGKCKKQNVVTKEQYDQDYRLFSDEKEELNRLDDLMELLEVPKGKRGGIKYGFQTTAAYRDPNNFYNFLCRLGIRADQAITLTEMLFGGDPKSPRAPSTVLNIAVPHQQIQTTPFLQYGHQNQPGYPQHDPFYEINRRLDGMERSLAGQSSSKAPMMMIRRPPLYDKDGKIQTDENGNIVRDLIEIPVGQDDARGGADPEMKELLNNVTRAVEKMGETKARESESRIERAVEELNKTIKKIQEEGITGGKTGGLSDEAEEKLRGVEERYKKELEELRKDNKTLEDRFKNEQHERDKESMGRYYEDRLDEKTKELESKIAVLGDDKHAREKKELEDRIIKLEDKRTGGDITDPKVQRVEAEERLLKTVKDTGKEIAHEIVTFITPLVGRDAESQRFNQVITLRTMEQQQGLKPGELTKLLVPPPTSEREKEETLEKLKGD